MAVQVAPSYTANNMHLSNTMLTIIGHTHLPLTRDHTHHLPHPLAINYPIHFTNDHTHLHCYLPKLPALRHSGERGDPTLGEREGEEVGAM